MSEGSRHQIFKETDWLNCHFWGHTEFIELKCDKRGAGAFLMIGDDEVLSLLFLCPHVFYC